MSILSYLCLLSLIERPPLLAFRFKIFECDREPTDGYEIGIGSRNAPLIWHTQSHSDRMLAVLVLGLDDAGYSEPSLSDSYFPPKRVCHHNRGPRPRRGVFARALKLLQLNDATYEESKAFTPTKEPTSDTASQFIALRAHLCVGRSPSCSGIFWFKIEK